MNKKKPFAPRRREPTELHFFSSLPVEEAANCIRRFSDVYVVEVETLDEDAYGFALYYHDKNAPNTGFVTGTLRRWEGTYTRLDCDGDVRRGNETTGIPPEKSFFLTIILVLSIVAYVLFFVRDIDNLPLVPMAILGAVLFIIGLFKFISKDARKPPESISNHVYIDQRDALLDAVKMTFATVGVIAYSPEALTEKMTDLTSEQSAENTSYG
jgi:hypothetical protein